jgi:hypothetical protein
VLAELVFEGRRPGHELEAEAVIDHREAAGGERHALAIGAGDIFAIACRFERLAGLLRQPVGNSIDLAAAKRLDQVSAEDDAAALLLGETFVTRCSARCRIACRTSAPKPPSDMATGSRAMDCRSSQVAPEAFT